MKHSVVLSIALLLLSFTDGAEFVSQPPTISPAPEPSNSDCSSVIYSMVDCLSFLTTGSTDLNPTKSCCVGIESVLEYNPQCFCSGLESSREMGFVLDNTKALAMPSICNVPIDPHCDVPALTPVASTFSPLAAPPMTAPSSAKSPIISEKPPTISPTPEPSNSDCSSVIYSMVDCLSFLTVGSTDLSPTKSCCVGIESVLEYNPQCLCSGLESSREMGFVLDNTKALVMPSICNAPIDPHCDVAALTPVASTVSPLAAPPMTLPSSTKSPAVTPSKPAITHSSPVASPSRPTNTHSSPAATASSPAATASSPVATAPSPFLSSTGNMSISKLFLAVVIVSSFTYISA